jgi:hypothetical protein
MTIGEINLIQQTQYTPTTPKYNFPYQTEKPIQIPQRLLELSIQSLKKTPNTPLRQESPSTETTTRTGTLYPHHGTTLMKLKPNTSKTPVVAIDVSSIKLGETRTGILLAVRGAVVWKQTRHYSYLRLGPFPFHITDNNIDEVCSLFQNTHKTPPTQGYTMPNAVHAQTRLTTLLEKWIQAYVNQTAHGSLILWDGCLAAGTPETPIEAMEQLLKEARNRQNTILAFSKATRLLLHGERVTDHVWKAQPPCLLRIDDCSIFEGSMRMFGNVFVAKLTAGSCAFRLDVDRTLSPEQVVDAVERLLGNELLSQSYPETLRLAHIYSTFTANEVLGLQRCIVKESRLEIVTRPNIRRLLFDRFGKGPEG